jgi:hypothetical protein
MTETDQFAALLETLQEIRDASHPEIPDELLIMILRAHAENPDDSTLHRQVQRAVEAWLETGAA